MQPLQAVPSDLQRPLVQGYFGVNLVNNMLPKIIELAGLCTCYANRSLRATA